MDEIISFQVNLFCFVSKLLSFYFLYLIYFQGVIRYVSEEKKAC